MNTYESIPEGYYLEAMKSGWSVQKFWHIHKFSQISSLIPDNPEITIMDVGCGPGGFFSQHNKKAARKIGIDLARAQINYARKRIPNVEWLCADVEKIHLPKADYIVFSEVLEHLQPNTKILRALHRALKNNGRLILTTPNYASVWPIIEKMWDLVSPVKYGEQHINPQTPKRLKKILEQNDFRIVKFKTIFLISPFVTFASEKLAERLNAFEQKITGKFGQVMIAVCEKQHNSVNIKNQTRK